MYQSLDPCRLQALLQDAPRRPSSSTCAAPPRSRAVRLPGATHIELSALPARAAELDREAPCVLYCLSGARSAQGCAYLAQRGFPAALSSRRRDRSLGQGRIARHSHRNQRWNRRVSIDREVDARGLNCPLPILRTQKALNDMKSGQVLRILATDPSALRDFQAFAKQTGNELLQHVEQDGVFSFPAQAQVAASSRSGAAALSTEPRPLASPPTDSKAPYGDRYARRCGTDQGKLCAVGSTATPLRWSISGRHGARRAARLRRFRRGRSPAS